MRRDLSKIDPRQQFKSLAEERKAKQSKAPGSRFIFLPLGKLPLTSRSLSVNPPIGGTGERANGRSSFTVAAALATRRSGNSRALTQNIRARFSSMKRRLCFLMNSSLRPSIDGLAGGRTAARRGATRRFLVPEKIAPQKESVTSVPKAQCAPPSRHPVPAMNLRRSNSIPTVLKHVIQGPTPRCPTTPNTQLERENAITRRAIYLPALPVRECLATGHREQAPRPCRAAPHRAAPMNVDTYLKEEV